MSKALAANYKVKGRAGVCMRVLITSSHERWRRSERGVVVVAAALPGVKMLENP